jgi:hypothetical protein
MKCGCKSGNALREDLIFAKNRNFANAPSCPAAWLQFRKYAGEIFDVYLQYIVVVLFRPDQFPLTKNFLIDLPPPVNLKM